VGTTSLAGTSRITGGSEQQTVVLPLEVYRQIRHSLRSDLGSAFTVHGALQREPNAGI